MELATAKTGATLSRGYHLVRIAVAVLLLAASFLKCWQLSTDPITGTGLSNSRWLLVAIVEFELFFAIWLLAGIWAKPTWAGAMACFSLFTCVSLCKAVSGHATCGCFGRVPINPWYTSAIDLMVVLSLVRWRPKESFFVIHRAIAVLLVWLAVGVPAAYVMLSHSEVTLSDCGGIVGNGESVILSPDAWIGKPFSLLGYIDTGYLLKTGTWVVLLYHHNCSVCRDVVPKYKSLAQKLTETHSGPQVALIECPPYDQSTESVNDKRAWSDGRLNDNRRWVVTTPLSLIVENGIVSSVLHDTQPDLLEEIWLSHLSTNARSMIIEDRFVYQPRFIAHEQPSNVGERIAGNSDNRLRLHGRHGHNER